MAGLYVHIPFCKQACHYCDFHFSTDTGTRIELVNALTHELALQKDYLGEEINTIYLGGGTPSILNRGELDTLFSVIRTHFTLAPHAEITLEANPDDLTKEKLEEIRAIGINRLSIGIQSFDDNLLKYLNRVHDANGARRCLKYVREAGFNNISIDLIYAIPGQSQKIWKATLQEALHFLPEHISSYGLTIEERTVFGNWSKRGKLHPMDEENSAQQFEMMADMLLQAGYGHYEISNFCKPGFHSRHNSSYWKQSRYLGIGPSAHSYNGESRQFNIRNNASYVRSINKGIVPFEREMLTRENKINEYILTTLRTEWGCDLSFLKQHLDDDLLHRCGDNLSLLQQNGLIMIGNGILQLSRKGKLLADKIAEDLMVSV